MRRTTLAVLEASNLGQMLGRLEYGRVHPAEESLAPMAKRRNGMPHGYWTGRVRDVLRGAPQGLRSGEIRARIPEVNSTLINLNAILVTMSDVERSGKPGDFVYRLTPEPPTPEKP